MDANPDSTAAKPAHVAADERARRSRPGLRGMLFISLALVTVVPTLLFGYAEMLRWRRVQLAQADQQHLFAARAVAEQLSMLLGANESAVELVAEEVLQLDTMDPARIQPILDAGRLRDPTLSIFVADAELTSVAASPALVNGLPAAGHNYRDRAYILDGLRRRALSLSGIEVGKMTGQPNLHAATGMWRADGSLLGVVAAAIDLGSVQRAGVRAAEVVPGLHLVVTDSNGRVVIHPEFSKEQAMVDLSGVALFAAVSGEEPRVRAGLDDNGVPVRAAVATMHDHGQQWTVAVFRTQAELEKEVDATRRTLAEGALAVLLFAIVISAALAAWLASPIVRLAAFASNPSAEIEVPSPRRSDPAEVALLLEACASMMRRLNGQTLELEAKVEARTAELARKNKDLDDHIRKLRETQAQLVHAGKMAAVGTLAAGVGHEINNPLAYIVANLAYASEEAAALAEQLRAPPVGTSAGARTPSARLDEMNDALRDALQGADRVRVIVRDLKIFSRSEDEQGAVDLHAVIDSAAKMGQSEFRARAQLVKAYGEIPLVDGNESRLSQVFLNLFINAAHAVGEGRAAENRIVVSTRLEEDRVIAEVRDTGCGMTKEIMARIFDPFFTTKPVGVGTGLGLSLCHTFIEQMGGEISVESEPGSGAVFRISLRASTVTKAPIPRPAKRADAAGAGRILVVDGEPRVTSALRRALGQARDVEIVHSARRALDLLSAPGSRFDVILCDLAVPELSGMELYEEVKRLAPRHLPAFVFVTGGAFNSRVKEFLERIPNPCVEEPFDPAQLGEQIAMHAWFVERQRDSWLDVA